MLYLLTLQQSLYIIVVTYYITPILKGQQNQGDELMSAAIEKLKTAIENAGAILIGAGSGFSTAAGYTYSGERFHRHFADFIGKYHFRDMYSAGFYQKKPA